MTNTASCRVVPRVLEKVTLLRIFAFSAVMIHVTVRWID